MSLVDSTLPGGVAAQSASHDQALRSFLAKEYPREVWYFLASLILLVALCNILSHNLSRWIPTAVSKDPEAIRTSRKGPIGQTFSLNAAELFLTALYVAILFAWTLTNSTTTTGSRYDPTYYSNRAASIAAVQTPLIVALGMKNNIISFLTGISFEKLNYLHRMCARAIVPLIWLHAGGRIQLGLVAGTALDNDYMRCGVLAATSLTLLCIVTLRPVRRLEYEAFFITHLILVMIILLAAFFHTRQFQRDHYIWPSFVLWGFDRLLRFARVVIFNQSYFGFSPGLGTLDAKAEVAAPGFVRLRLRRSKHFHWTAGQCAFLTMPSVSLLPFEAHPFTIANADRSRETPLKIQEENEAAVIHVEQGHDLIFLINARQGFTRRLMAIAEKGGSMKVFVDGPYGTPPYPRGFDTIVFIAGGSGITFTLPLFTDLARRARHDPLTCRKVVFAWSIRVASHVNLVYDELLEILANMPEQLEVEICIHISKARIGSYQGSSIDSEVHQEEEKLMSKLSRLRSTTVGTGRANVKGIIDDACALARGSVSVNVCGPADMGKHVRAALRSPVKGPLDVLKGGPSIDLHIEQFGIA